MKSYIELELNKIQPDPNQPRKRFDEAALQTLAASIEEHGVIQPIEVRSGDGVFILNHGERRWRAAGIAGLETIPAIVEIEEARDEDDRLVRGLVENLQREDMPPIDEARAYQNLLVRGMTVRQVSRLTGSSTTTISHRIAWLALEPEILELCNRGQLPRDKRAAKALLRIEDSQVRVALAKRLAHSGTTSHKAVEGAVGRLLAKMKVESGEPQREGVKTPSLTLVKQRRPSGSVRRAAKAMCEDCWRSADVAVAEPAWTLVAAAAEKMCKRCEAWERGDALTVCRTCPGVTLLKEMVANG